MVQKTLGIGKHLWKVNNIYVLAINIEEAIEIFSNLHEDEEIIDVHKNTKIGTVWFKDTTKL